MSYRGRFAPSPTGAAHLGTARTALLAWLRARQAGGQFVMRIEDLDGPRVVPGASEAMLEDLRWLGLDWDEGPDVGGPLGPYVQSARFDRYAEALERLRASGRVYPCTCSRKEIAQIASAPGGPAQDPGEELMYPGTCRDGPTHPDREPSWRFRMDGHPTFTDAVYGEVHESAQGDFVVARADGVFAYQLAVVVDDRDMAMTEVVRGHDLLSSTSRQLALFGALGATPPSYLHVPLVLDASGERLGKRHASLSIAALREAGQTPTALIGRMARSLGHDVDAISARELLSIFELQRVGTAPSVGLERG
jgi:glutamyl-tRNA synthetase